MTAAVDHLLNISLLEMNLDYIITGTLTELLCALLLAKCDNFAAQGNQKQEAQLKIAVTLLGIISHASDSLSLSQSVFNA